MPESRRESAVITSVIENILCSYPAGNPILREILQNSDDAGAREQSFILDRRSYSTASLLDPELKDTQGPALLAVNDTVFSESDWVALARISGSNKETDETKIGRYGLGFRSCYHLTDNPQVLSGERLQIFDPHQRFADAISGGASINIMSEATQFSDQFSVFRAAGVRPGNPYNGTAVRLPLRTPKGAERSNIRQETFASNDIRTLFDQFISEEASEVLLFLKNITKIKFLDISQSDDTEECATITITNRKTPARDVNDKLSDSFSVTVDTTIKGTSKKRKWRLFHYAIAREEAFITLQSMMPNIGFRSEQLAEDKLIPHIGLAAPLEDPKSVTGSLFTYLPLPIRPGFHVCIHGCFALMPDRQGLRNKNEATMGGREALLITWNRLIFDELIPVAWANLLQGLAQENEGSWDLWPIAPTAPKDYWFSLLENIVKVVDDRDMSVFPTLLHPPSYVSTRDPNVLFTAASTDIKLAAILRNAGLNIIQPPTSLLDAVQSIKAEKILRPATATSELSSQHTIDKLSDSDKRNLLEYLLSESCDQKSIEGLEGMPFIPIAAEAATPKWRAISRGAELLIPPSIVVEEALCTYSRNMVSLSRLPTDEIRTAFVSYPSTSDLRMRPLKPADVLLFLRRAVQSWEIQPTFSSDTQGEATSINWLVNFWNTIPPTLLPEEESLVSLHLLPTIHNSIARIGDRVFSIISTNSQTADTQIAAWEKLGVRRVAHPDLLQTNSTLQPYLSRDLSYLLRLVDHNHISSLTPKDWDDIKISIIGIINQSTPKLTTSEISTLAKFKIFRIWKGKTQVDVGAASDMRYFVSGSLSKCPLPTLSRSSTFIEYSPDRAICDMLRDGGDILPLEEPDILGLIINKWDDQEAARRPEFLERIFARFDDLTPGIKKTFLAKRFITVGRTLKKVKEVLDPESLIFKLYLASERRSPTGFFEKGSPGLQFLRARGYLINSLTPEIVRDRIDTLSASHDDDRFTRLRSLLRLLNENWSADFEDIIESRRDLEWIPCRMGDGVDEDLCAPQECRDEHSNVYLFDLHLRLASIDSGITNPQLRTALGWEQPFNLDQLRTQLDNTLTHPDHCQDVSRFKALIKEYSRQCQFHLNAVLADITSWPASYFDREWVPTALGGLVAPKYCLIQADFNVPPFKRVASSLNGCLDVLRALGCNDGPSVGILTEELARHASDKVPVGAKEGVISDLLRELARHDLGGVAFYLPCLGGVWQANGSVYYGGPSTAPTRVVQDIKYYQLYPSISSVTARSLGVPSYEDLVMSEHIRDDGDDSDDGSDEELQEPLIDRISRLLDDYSVEFAFNELLANALDAGATEFRIVHDQGSMPRKFLWTDKLTNIISGPALFVYNNEKFEEADFKGVVKLGRGSKQERTDSEVIGRYGLGAATMYHFTDVPIIISNKHIMFLDPSETYLTPRKKRKGLRTSLRYPLSIFLELHPEIQTRLGELLNFTLNEGGFYNRTIFWLPLHRSDGSRFSEHPRTEVGVVLRDYETLGRNSFFFTHIRSVEIGTVDQNRKSQDHWRIRRIPTKYPMQTELEFSHQPSERWLVTHKTYPVNKLPQKYNAVVNGLQVRGRRVDLQLREAIRISPPLEDFDPLEHFLFSTLQLPTKLRLPFHLDAPFALPSSRGGIHLNPETLDGDSATASSYNRWLLRELVPELHAETLATVLSVQPDSHHWHLWPTRKEGDEITQIITDSFFVNLHTFPCAFVRTIPGAVKIAKECFFTLTDVPKAMKELLEWVNPEDVSIPPKNISQKLEADSKVPKLDATAISGIIRSGSNVIKQGWGDQLLDSSNIDGTLLYFLESRLPEDVLDGLPLLITVDGTITQFDLHNPIYIAQPFKRGDRYHQTGDLAEWIGINRTLSPSHHPNSYQHLCEQSPSLPSVLRLPDSVSRLLEERLGRSYSKALNHQDTEWVSNFLNLWPKIFNSPQHQSFYNDLFEFPLLNAHTITGGECIHVSLGALKTGKAIHFIEFPDEKIPMLLTTLNILMVRPLRDYLKALVPSLTANDKRALQVAEMLVHQQWHSRGSDYQPLAEWLKMNVDWKELEENEKLKKLPIWDAVKDGEDTLASLEEIEFLPKPATIQNKIIRQYFPQGRYVAEMADQLKSSIVERQRLSLKELHQAIEPTLPRGPLESFLIDEYGKYLLFFHEDPSKVTLRAPNQNLELLLLEDLYDARVPLFRCTLSKGYFLLPKVGRMFQKKKYYQYSYNMKVNLATFIHCAVVFNQGIEDLDPPEQDRRQEWGQLDELKFIRRNPNRCLHASYPIEDRFHRHLPSIISPSQVVLSEYHKIAWTQRGILLHEPSANLVAVNVSFGIPTIDDVVAHLRCLATVIARQHPRNRSLYEDIHATYKWLNEKSRTEGAVIPIAPDESLFLNVVDPNDDDWEWLPASRLMLGLGRDTGVYNRPLRLLRQFENLLIAVNVKEMREAKLDPSISETNPPTSRIQVRNKMRLDGKLVDAYFLPTIDAKGARCGFHRFELATLCPHFQTMFSGGWGEQVQNELEFNGTALGCEAFLEFAYTGQFKLKVAPTEIEGNDARAQNLLYELLLLLNLANKWDLVDLKRDITQKIVIEEMLIDPHTYRGINEMATLFNVLDLQKSCKTFEEENVFVRDEQSESWNDFFSKRAWLYDCGLLSPEY